MENTPVYPRDRFFRDAVPLPVDPYAFGQRSGVVGWSLAVGGTYREPIGRDGFRYLMNLSRANVGLMLRNWRNAP